MAFFKKFFLLPIVGLYKKYKVTTKVIAVISVMSLITGVIWKLDTFDGNLNFPLFKWASSIINDWNSSEQSAQLPHQAGERRIVRINGIDVAFRWIPPGTFFMGSEGDSLSSDDYSIQEFPVHEVILTKGYWLAETETTQRLWEAVSDDNPSLFKSGRNAFLPVEGVTWKDCNTFIDELNALMSGTQIGGEFRLPTEAEWEYACRAGTLGKYNVDGEPLDSLGWYRSNSGNETHEVGQKTPNAWGLYDMHGNVWEWCADWEGEYQEWSVTDPLGVDSGSNRIRRGGSLGSGANRCRSACRDSCAPTKSELFCGFRLLLTDSQ